MTLTRWFRDYLYISLGGSRKGRLREYGNLFLVFALCGFWHGAAWTFLAWGAYHGALLVLERMLMHSKVLPLKYATNWLSTFIFVVIGWVLFRANTFTMAYHYLSAMFGFGINAVESFVSTRTVFATSSLCVLGASAIAVFFPYDLLSRFPLELHLKTRVFLQGGFALLLLVTSAVFLSGAAYHPFIYFRF